MGRSFSYREALLTWSSACIGRRRRRFLCLPVVLVPCVSPSDLRVPCLCLGIEKSREEFLEFAHVMAGGETEVLEAFASQMRQRIIDAADRNTETNDERSGLRYRHVLALFPFSRSLLLPDSPCFIDSGKVADPCPDHPHQTGAIASGADERYSAASTVPPNREIREGDLPTRRPR